MQPEFVSTKQFEGVGLWGGVEPPPPSQVAICTVYILNGRIFYASSRKSDI